ncbi:MAG TPA: UDP-3-O-(3-hydroxymyristoyl)glucosamine N-acyltransferase [Conexibacter sp.]|nr:UDP-3-O-(3-hydroxymyristoyl)glucosamine N-acyltransferase [Conexibacter sp.]
MSPTVAALLETLGRAAADPAAAAVAAAMEVARPAPIREATGEDLTFCTAGLPDADDLLAALSARVLIVDEPLATRAAELAGDRVPVIVASPNARLDFARVLAAHFTPPRPTGISPHAVIAPGARLGADVYVGPLATIGEQVAIGDRGVIHAGVHVYGPVTIGAGVTIHAGTVIGAAGYGYERAEDGRLEPFPQLGSVEIGDDVEIGANACIDRGALGATQIEAGARIDNLVHIAHNARIGRDAAVIAHAMVAGGAQIGERAWIAPAATIRDQLRVGVDATVGLGAVVVKPVPDGATVAGNPARELRR